jgi:hypothetical protein
VKITVDRDSARRRRLHRHQPAASPNNYNAPKAVARAAVLYVSSAAGGRDIPMNAGCLKPIASDPARRSMLNAEYPAAVIAGNVEVSQAVTECLFGALDVMAGSQGTMNNFIWGNDTFQYYETICSAAPARARASTARLRAGPHDQHPRHRSGGSRNPLPGGAGRLPHLGNKKKARSPSPAGTGATNGSHRRNRSKPGDMLATD